MPRRLLGTGPLHRAPRRAWHARGVRDLDGERPAAPPPADPGDASPVSRVAAPGSRPGAVDLPAPATSSLEFWAWTSPKPPETGTNWNCWLDWPLQVHWSIAAPAAVAFPSTSRQRPSLPMTSWWLPPGKPPPPDPADVR